MYQDRWPSPRCASNTAQWVSSRSFNPGSPLHNAPSLPRHNLQRRLSMRRKQPGEQIRREALWKTTHQSQPPREVRCRRRPAEFSLYLGELPGLEDDVGNQRHRILGQDHKRRVLHSEEFPLRPSAPPQLKRDRHPFGPRRRGESIDPPTYVAPERSEHRSPHPASSHRTVNFPRSANARSRASRTVPHFRSAFRRSASRDSTAPVSRAALSPSWPIKG